MKNEILRMERITLIEDGVTLLNNLTLNIYSGEIMGLLSINANGQSALLDLICQNTPIHFGRIYFDEQLVNSHRHSSMSYNPVAMIEKKSWLVDSLTVSDNVFVLCKGFSERIISPHKLDQKLRELTEEIGIKLYGGALIDSLSDFECCVIEILKAVISGVKLVILQDISSFLNGKEMAKIHEIMHYYTKKGITFLYVCNQYDEISRLCDCMAIMENGKIRSILKKQDMEEETFDYPMLVRRTSSEITNHASNNEPQNYKKDTAPVFKMEDVYGDNIKGMSFVVHRGECVVVLDTDGTFNEDIIEIINGKAVKTGTIYVEREPLSSAITKNRTAIIPEKPVQNMLFPHLSYLDNICFTADKRLTGFWRSARIRKSITNEFRSLVGENIFIKNIDTLSVKELYCLAYHRIYFQNPRIVVCVKPFSTIDLSLRLYVVELMQRLLDRGISLIILEKNISELLPLADRMVLIKDGQLYAEFNRERLQNLSDEDIL